MLLPSKGTHHSCLCLEQQVCSWLGVALSVCVGVLLQVVVACIMTQMNYLNKALDLFNTAIVTPIYYVMFTLLTIIASVIMFQVRGCMQGGACT
jgi:hypothetical protein